MVEQYPKSDYAHDSLQRMVYLRNRLASYEVHVARYYYKRGAYVAAAQRADPRSTSTTARPPRSEAMQILIASYDKLKLQPSWPPQAREVFDANYPPRAAVQRPRSTPGGSSGRATLRAA